MKVQDKYVYTMPVPRLGEAWFFTCLVYYTSMLKLDYAKFLIVPYFLDRR
jgi:hypothetical protein